ncbi:MAG TPA: helix-turn-helix domain-containing protein [Ignavibacteria bacterium]|nr:helix-turn-helix domain-containing protein [Ignavibacteria bacterium]
MKELIDKLESLGFTTYESKVFLVLMKGHNMTAAEIAEEAGIPRTSVYDILKIFAEKGYCNELETPTKLRYEAIDPEIIEGKIENELNKTFGSQLKILKSLFESIKPLYKASLPSENKVDVELIKGFNKFRPLKLIDLIKSSQKEILIMNRLEAHVSKDLDNEAKKFYKKGGVVRSIYEASLNFKIESGGKWIPATKEELVKLLDSFQKQGEQIKLASKVPQIMAIFDKQTVFISLIDETVTKNNRTDIIIRNKNYAEYAREIFENYWSKSMTLDEYKKLKN